MEYFLSDDNVVGFYRDKAFEITNDISTMRRGYGTLLITQVEEMKSHGGKNYAWIENRVYHTKGNQPVNVPSGETEVLRITGNIQQLENAYSIIPAANRPVYLGKMLKLTTESGAAGVGEMTVKTYQYKYEDEFGEYDTAQRVEISGNERSRIYLDVPLKDVPSQLAKPLVWEGNFKFTADSFVIKKPNLWGVNAQISKFKIGVQELRVVYHESTKQYAVEFKGLLDILGVIKTLLDFFGNISDEVQKYAFYADIVVDNFSVYEDGTIDFKTEVGIGLPQLKIGPFLSDVAPVSSKQTGGVEARLKIDTFTDLYSIFFGLSLPSLEKFTTSGGTEYTRDGALQANVGLFLVRLPVGFLIFPDTIAAEYKDNVGFIQIPSIPAAINQLGGGIYNLHTIRDAVKYGTYPDFNTDFTFGIVDTISPVIKGNRMLSIQDATISLGTTELKLSGDLYFYIVKLLSAEAGLMFYPITGAYIRGEVSLLDVVIIEAYASARYDHQTKSPYIGGYGLGRLQVPSWSLIAPGLTLGEAKAEINTQFVEAYAKWGIFTVGARYYWRTGKVSLASVPQDRGLLVIEQTNEDGITEVIEFGTNFRPIEVKPSKETLPPGGLVILDWTEPQKEYEFSSTGKGGLLVQARYGYDVEDFELTILDPNGKEYPIIYNGVDANVVTSEYIPEGGSEKDKKNYIAVFIPAEDNEAGTWRIESNHDAEFEAYEVKEPAEIESVNVVNKGGLNYDVSFIINGFDADSTCKADVYLMGESQDSRDDSSGQEKLIEQFGDLVIKLAQDVEVNSANVTIPVELPDGIPSGDYRMVVALKEYEQGHEVKSLYTHAESEPFSVVNDNLPPAPQNVTAQSIGNSAIRVSWDAVDEDDITGYFVAVASQDGQEQERHFIPAQEGLQSYSVDIRVKGLDEETTGKDILVAVCALRETETGAPGSGDDGDDDSDDYLAEDAEVFPLTHGRYLVKWKAIDGISDYIITLSGETETESFLYHDSSQGQQSELEATFTTSRQDSYYMATVRGYLPKDVYAKNVEVEDDLFDDSRKKISWDKVEGNIASYTICAEPVTGSGSGEDDEPVTLVYQYVPTEQQERYEIALEGFVPGVDYKVTVTASEAQQQPSRYLGDMSEYVALTVPVPRPPMWTL